MTAPSYVKPRHERRFGLRERLLLGLLVAALGTVLVAVVGWVSFQRVVSSQQAIVRDTLPAADALHEAVRANARLAALAPRLLRADSAAELDQLRAALGVDVPLVRDRLAALRSPHVEAELRERLQATGDRLAAGLEGMSAAIDQRLRLRAARLERIDTLRAAIDGLDELARIHADNATAQLVSTLTTLLQPDPGQGAPSLAEREAARERVLDLDIDSLERMHELNLTVHALGFLIGRLDELDSGARLQAARVEFAAHLALLARRLADIADPGGREQGERVLRLLASALDEEGTFALRAREIALRAQVETLQGVVGELTTELDALAGELIHRGGRILAAAGSAAERSATSGLIAFGVIAAALLLVTLGVTVHALRRHTLGRLRALEEATLALASGRREVAIDTAGDDELASLAVALERFRANAIERDRFAEELRQQQQELENQVLARTAQLREANAALARETADHARARHAAEQADRAKTAFLGTVSHELRTPLAGILGLLELVEDASSTTERKQYQAQMRAAAVLLLELLEDMLDFARIEAGGVQVDKASFSLRDTVNDVFAVQGTRAAVRGLALIAEVDPALPDAVQGDRRKLSQILLNLVGNAIKFSDAGAVTVRVRAGTQPDQLHFAVEDHGIGIEPARQQEVFEPFVQVRDSGRHHAGTGLGLAVCRRLVEAMGGAIELKSAPGQGTTVSFEIPLPATAAAAVEALPAATEPERTALPPGHRVLVVEDDEVNRMVVERFLDALGQQAVCAPDIQNALRLLQARPIDLALIDMNLPDGDGRELLARLRALPAHAHTPAVLMSAHIPRREVDALLEAGFAAFLSKPFARERLRALLADLLAEPAAAAPTQGTAGVAEVLQATDWIDADFLRAEREALGEETVADIVGVFRTQGQPLIDALLAAARAGEHEACARLAHKLRGAAGNVGAGRLAECAGALEEALKPDPKGDAPRAGAIGDLAARAGELGEAWSYTLQALDALRSAADDAEAQRPDQTPPGSTSAASR